MMKNILLPVAFIGGFLTAVILGIKVIGVINMILIAKVLMLNLAFLLGKLIFGKVLLTGHGHYPMYYGYSGHTLANRRYDNDFPFGRNFYTPQSTFPYEIPQNFLNQPPSIIRQQQQQPPSNFMLQPQMNLVEPHLYSSFKMQAIQPPNNQQYFDNLLNDQQRLSNENTMINVNENQHLKSTLSPMEMERLLTDALSRISEASTSVPFVRYKRKSPNHQSINLLKPIS